MKPQDTVLRASPVPHWHTLTWSPVAQRWPRGGYRTHRPRVAALQLGGPGAAVAVLTTRAPSASPVRHQHSARRGGARSAVTYATLRPSRRLLRPRHRDGLRDDDPEFTMSTRGGPSRSQKCSSQAPDMPDLPPGAAVGPPQLPATSAGARRPGAQPGDQRGTGCDSQPGPRASGISPGLTSQPHRLSQSHPAHPHRVIANSCCAPKGEELIEAANWKGPCKLRSCAEVA